MSHPIHVIGHRNPDTDASTSAAGYARFLNLVGRYDVPVVPIVPGALTPQTRWVFEQAGVEPPAIISSFAPRVGDVISRDPDFLTVDTRLSEANDALIRTGHSMLPVVDGERLQGVYSNREDVSRFLMSLDVVPLAGTLLTWNDLVEMPGMSVNGAAFPDETMLGSLVIAMEGDNSWKATVASDDILICGNTDVLRRIESARRPFRAIVVSPAEPPAQVVQTLNSEGVYLLHFVGNVAGLLQSLTKQIRLGSLELGRGTCVGPDDLLSDVRPLIESSRRAIPVLGSDDKLVGVIARSDLDSELKRRAVLVDHFESSQAVAGVEHLEIIEVVDHHRIGNIETASPIRVDCRPIGSSASIVALNYFEAGLEPDKGTAILLLGGLCADTLALKGPTATDLDRQIAGRLAEIGGVDVDTFGINVLRAGDDLLTASPADIWNRDQKLFGIRNHQFAVAQLETVALDTLPAERLESFRSQLQQDFERNDYLSSILVVTDVLKRESWITGFESDRANGSLAATFGKDNARAGWMEAPGVVSRKKQIIPQLMQTFSELSL